MPLEPRKSSLVLVYPAKCFLTQQDFQLPIPVEQIVQNTAPNPQIQIDEPQVVTKSYPAYWEDLQKAGFKVCQNAMQS